MLVHHVHREQWPVVGPRPPARIGWWIESWLAPRVNRRSRYVAVSGYEGRELGELGVSPEQVTVIYNGIPPATCLEGVRAAAAALVVVSRLVPHKQIEHAITCVSLLRRDFPDLTLVVMGSGWWHDELVAHAERCAVLDRVVFAGHVEDLAKHRELARAWVHLMPSLKEGWGLSIVEAATHATPSIAYYSAGGVQESIQDGVTGLLALDLPEFVECTRTLLLDEELRTALGTKAETRSRDFSWGTTAQLIDETLSGACQRHAQR